ncbi:hypothetical protein OSB04_003109 [Centaurea solstitialis]|uniref:Protein kinase domain-containing protein n=1 Tax=Centaurea solstitialis TaxID=347529 RepID=A0AA38UC44_9ASTR|nr:hypothetical protein OSB04_003109 [Centaurea solstitialis]
MFVVCGGGDPVLGGRERNILQFSGRETTGKESKLLSPPLSEKMVKERTKIVVAVGLSDHSTQQGGLSPYKTGKFVYHNPGCWQKPLLPLPPQRMVMRAMGGRWTTTYKLGLSCFPLLILVLVHGCSSLDPQGLALLEFRAGVSRDPYGIFRTWNSDDHDPCSWSNVHCVDGNVQVLDLNGLSLEGVLAPEIGSLIHLRRLVLSHNGFFGGIPKELGELRMLEVLDLRDNNLSGHIPSELARMHSLKRLLLCNNNFEGSIPMELRTLNFLYEMQYDENLLSIVADGIAGESEPEMVKNGNVVRRKLAENSPNLAAAPSPIEGFGPPKIIALPSSRSSGSFPAVPKEKKGKAIKPPTSSYGLIEDISPTNDGPPKNLSCNILHISSLSIGIALCFVCRTEAVKTIGPWRSGISGQLQKAFVTGVPKLNRTELETACEDFSNIIEAKERTLSSGVEICVASTIIACLKDWSKRAELGFRKKIDTLSRVNHKNFVNLIGYCEEDEPFVRMMVFEYAPNGSLSEHLHVEELEHLDWSSRMRIIMGTAYCLEYMHELNPPVPHSNLNANLIRLTDDYAPKVAEMSFWKDFVSKAKVSSAAEAESEHSELPPLIDTETNVYCFGMLMIEIISGKLPYSDQQGPLGAWAAQYLNDKRNASHMVDPTLESFKHSEVEGICEVIEECIQQDAGKRPTMKQVVMKLREVLAISPEQAIPRLSPLWWAELEILSGEAAEDEQLRVDIDKKIIDFIDDG